MNEFLPMYKITLFDIYGSPMETVYLILFLDASAQICTRLSTNLVSGFITLTLKVLKVEIVIQSLVYCLKVLATVAVTVGSLESGLGPGRGHYARRTYSNLGH